MEDEMDYVFHMDFGTEMADRKADLQYKLDDGIITAEEYENLMNELEQEEEEYYNEY